MKKQITYLFIIVYATVMLKPLMPYVSDLMAHTFWKYEHISTVHFENGKYHTHFESLEAAKKTDPVKPQDFSKHNFSVEFHSMGEPTFNFSVKKILPVYFPNIQSSIPLGCLQTDLRPPQL